MMVNDYPLYEAHLTFRADDRAEVAAHADSVWRFSAIDGDPLLGANVFCYLTAHETDIDVLRQEMKDAVAHLASVYGVQPVRQKIERVIYDTKTGRNELRP